MATASTKTSHFEAVGRLGKNWVGPSLFDDTFLVNKETPTEKHPTSSRNAQCIATKDESHAMETLDGAPVTVEELAAAEAAKAAEQASRRAKSVPLLRPRALRWREIA
eukprot:s3136_g3.t1